MKHFFTLPFLCGFFTSFLTGMAFHGLVHLPGFLHRLGAGEAEIGILTGVMALTAVLCRPLVGWWIDTRGRRWTLLLGTWVTTLCAALYLTVDSIGLWIYVIRVLHGFAAGLVFSSLFTLAADLSPPERRAQGIGLFGASGILSVAAGGVLGDWLLSRWDYHMLFLVITGFAGMSIVLAALLPKGAAATAAQVTASQASGESDGTWTLLTRPDLVRIWGVTMGLSMGFTSYFTFLKTYLESHGEHRVGTFFVAYAVAASALRLFGGSLPDRLGRKRVLVPAMACMAAGAMVLSVSVSPSFLVGAGVLCGFGHGYAFPILSALVVERVRQRNRGRAVALFTATFDLGLLVGGPALGYVVEFQGYGTMFVVTGMCVLASLLAFLWFDRRTEPVSLAAGE